MRYKMTKPSKLMTEGKRLFQVDLTEEQYEKLQFLAVKHGYKTMTAYARAKLLEDYV